MAICVFGGQLKAEGLVDDADEFLLGVESDDALGVTIERTDEQEGDAAYLEDVGDVAVLRFQLQQPSYLFHDRVRDDGRAGVA